MSTNPVIYTYKRCFSNRLIQIFSKFGGKQLDFVYLDDMSQNNLKKLTERSPIGKFPLLQEGEFFLSGTIAITKYILHNNPAAVALLYGKDFKTNASNDMWVDFVTYNVWPFHDEVIGQILGNLEPHEELFQTAIEDLLQVLIKINKHFAFRTFLHSHQVSFSDIVLAHALSPYFSLVLNEQLRESIPHLTRWYLFVANVKEVSTVLGKPRLCKVTQKPAEPKLLNATLPSKSEKSKDNKPQVQEKKPQVQEKKPKVEETKTPNDTLEAEAEAEKQAKKKNPLDSLPPSSLNLDEFKKDFLNTKEKKESLQKFWQNFDPKGYSFWYMYYNKSGDQGKVQWKTCNLKSNFLQKLEKFRRYTFAAHGVYGQEPNLDIEGVWMWRGLEIPEDIKEHDSYDLLTIKSLNPENPEDKALIEEYWLNVDVGQTVKGKTVVDVEHFK